MCLSTAHATAARGSCTYRGHPRCHLLQTTHPDDDRPFHKALALQEKNINSEYYSVDGQRTQHTHFHTAALLQLRKTTVNAKPYIGTEERDLTIWSTRQANEELPVQQFTRCQAQHSLGPSVCTPTSVKYKPLPLDASPSLFSATFLASNCICILSPTSSDPVVIIKRL